MGFHKYKSLYMTDCFSTDYVDITAVIKHIVWYQECECCGKRRMKDNYKKEVVYTNATPHGPMERARLEWENFGVVYIGKGSKFKYRSAKQPITGI